MKKLRNLTKADKALSQAELQAKTAEINEWNRQAQRENYAEQRAAFLALPLAERQRIISEREKKRSVKRTKRNKRNS